MTGVGLFLGRVFIDRKAGDQSFANELRDDLFQEVKELRQEIKHLKADADEWRNKYWALSVEVARLKSQVNGGEAK